MIENTIITFLIGSVIGATLIATLLVITVKQQPPLSAADSIALYDQSTIQPQPAPAFSPEPSIEPSPESTPPKTPLTGRAEEVLGGLIAPLRNLETKLYQEGITTQGTVETVFAGQGFILRDGIKNQIFVEWTEEPPVDGRDVIVTGKLHNRLIDHDEDLSQQEDYPSRLESFLQDHPTTIKASKLKDT